MKRGKTLILVDAIINLLLGVILLSYSDLVVQFFGLPLTRDTFYPNVLGGVLFGIGLALVIEFRRKNSFIGLGLGGAVSINLIGGIVLLFYLLSDKLVVPAHRRLILWILEIILIGISAFELFTFLKHK